MWSGSKSTAKIICRYGRTYRLYKADHLKVVWRDLHQTQYRNCDRSKAIEATLNWLDRAQYNHGGFSAGYTFGHGWLPPYPETTGYLIPSLLSLAKTKFGSWVRDAALKAARWLRDIQHPDGWYPSKFFVANQPGTPSIFNTAQVIEGLLAAHGTEGDERCNHIASRAAGWIVGQQERDGSWRRWAYNGMPHSYYARASWLLIKAGYFLDKREFIKAGENNLDWVLRRQLRNGWFGENGFLNHTRPLTHTIAYTMEGLLESGVLLEREDYIEGARKPASALLKEYEKKGWLGGRYDERWQTEDDWSCVTGSAQTALVWFRLYEVLGEAAWRHAAVSLNDWLCSTQVTVSGREFPPGGLKGSHPVWGDYDRFAMPLHAAKFFLDAIILEDRLTQVARD